MHYSIIADDVRRRLSKYYKSLWQSHCDTISSHFPVSIYNVLAFLSDLCLPRQEQILLNSSCLRKQFLQNSNLDIFLVICPTLEHARAIFRTHRQQNTDTKTLLHVNFPTDKFTVHYIYYPFPVNKHIFFNSAPPD